MFICKVLTINLIVDWMSHNWMDSLLVFIKCFIIWLSYLKTSLTYMIPVAQKIKYNMQGCHHWHNRILLLSCCTTVIEDVITPTLYCSSALCAPHYISRIIDVEYLLLPNSGLVAKLSRTELALVLIITSPIHPPTPTRESRDPAWNWQ